MSKDISLVAASRIGLRMQLEGEALMLEAAASPPADILAVMARYKPEIVAELRHRPRKADWDDEDWQAYFDERAGVLEFDAGLARTDAECRAFADCVTKWLDRCPPSSEADGCLHCKRNDCSGEDKVPRRLCGPVGAWLHAACWPAWRAARHAEAEAALALLGLRAPQRGAPR